MVYYNPKIWPKPVVSDALVSHVDFVPTIAALMGTKAKVGCEQKLLSHVNMTNSI